MNKFKALSSNSNPHKPTFYFDVTVPKQTLIEDASHRLDAIRELAKTMAMVEGVRGLGAQDVAAFGLVVQLLASDASELLDAAVIVSPSEPDD